jgi:hypothetical protein
VKSVLALALCLASGACSSGGEEVDACETDADCDGECSRINECVEAGSAIRVELAWTVAGEPPSDESCAPFEALEVFFYDGGREATSYAPIPCTLSRSTYDKMPPRLDRIDLAAYGSGGVILDSQSAELEPTGTTTVTFDLQP